MGWGDKAFEMAKEACTAIIELRTEIVSVKELVRNFEARLEQRLSLHQQDQKGEIRDMQARLRELETRLAETRGDVRSVVGEAVALHLKQHGLQPPSRDGASVAVAAIGVLPTPDTQDS